MITLHYEVPKEEWPLPTLATHYPPPPIIDMTIQADSLDEVVENIERFLRAVYGWIPTDEHLEFVKEESTDC